MSPQDSQQSAPWPTDEECAVRILAFSRSARRLLAEYESAVFTMDRNATFSGMSSGMRGVVRPANPGITELTIGQLWDVVTLEHLATLTLDQVEGTIPRLTVRPGRNECPKAPWTTLPDAKTRQPTSYVRVLRGAREHWYERGRSWTTLQQSGPPKAPHRVGGSAQLAGVPVSGILTWLDGVESWVRAELPSTPRFEDLVPVEMLES